MNDPYDLQRFVDAQEGSYRSALAELRGGSKRTHWMWFIFPQLRGLGHSLAAQQYGIASMGEAKAYLQHGILGPRLRESIDTLLPWATARSAEQILGPVDAMKLRSSLTLFDQADPTGVFADALERFYNGERDERTLALLNRQAYVAH